MLSVTVIRDIIRQILYTTTERKPKIVTKEAIALEVSLYVVYNTAKCWVYQEVITYLLSCKCIAIIFPFYFKNIINIKLCETP